MGTHETAVFSGVPFYSGTVLHGREEIMNLLAEINERGTTVLVVTHNKEIVNSMKKRVVTMHEGVIVSDEKEGGYHEA